MSQGRGRIEEIEDASDLLPYLEQYYQIPVLVGLLAFMLWSRVRDWENFVVDGTVFFSGNDAWYHYRMTSYTVEHWPETNPFDPWTYFPYGTHSSQFGTVFDQLMATAALVIGLGNPSDHTVRMVVLFAPAVFGTALAIPTYYIGKRAAGRFAGLVAVGVMALFGSFVVSRGTVGFSDHHIAEALFQTTAVLATMVALSVAETEKPVWELVEARDVAAFRRPVGWAVVAGVATALYVWSWPPGVFLIGILGTFYLVELSSTQAHGQSPEPVALVGAVSMATTGVLTLATLEEVSLGATSFNLVQPGLAFAVAAGCLFMAWLAREWDDRQLANYQYPVAVVALLAVITGAVAVALPDLFGFFSTQVTRIVGLSTTDTAGTVGEAQSLPFEQLYPRYRFTLFIALVGVAYVGLKQLLSRTRAEVLLLAVWLVFMLFATLTQRRFDYYLGVTVAVMTGYTLATVADFTNLFDSIDDIDNWQLLSIVAVVLIVFAPFVLTSSGILAVQQTSAAPGQAPQAWNESLGWMQDNTPEEGNLYGHDNEEEMAFYGTFEATDDHEYEPGYYGVMSWWDYGHWITAMGERIPTANPFQLGTDDAADFLLSGDEQRANEVLDELADGEGTETRYVMVDWKMATTHSPRPVGGKYFAPFQFTTDDSIVERDYYHNPRTGMLYRYQDGFGRFFPKKQPYYESTVVRLYNYHGSRVEPSPVVLDWEIQTIQGRSFKVSQGFQRFNSMREARNFTANDPTSQIGGTVPYPRETVPAMERYRLVGTSDRSASRTSRGYLTARLNVARGANDANVGSIAQLAANPGYMQQTLYTTEPQWVKVFERVPGATVEGEGAPPNSEVQVAVRMTVPADDSSFVYRQHTTADENGEFELTVPYSTTGYDEWGPEEGYTNVSVRAADSYQVRTEEITNESGYIYRFTGEVDVTEGQVVGEDDSPATVVLEQGNATAPTQQNRPADSSEGDDDSSAGNETANGSADGGDATPTPAPTGTDAETDTDTATPSETTATAAPTTTAGNSPRLPGPEPRAGLAALVPLVGVLGIFVVDRPD